MESLKARKHRLLYLRNWRKRNRKYVRAFDRKRWKNDPIRRNKRKKYYSENPEKHMETQRMVRYGISPEQYEMKRKTQNDRCALCGRKERRINYRTGKRQSLSVDHDHETGKNRDLLCRDCNFALGLFEDNVALLLKAIQYLKRHAKEYNGRPRTFTFGQSY